MFCLVCTLALFFTGCADVGNKKVEIGTGISGEASKCVECHQKKQISTLALRDWKFSTHAERGVTCVDCHIPVDNASTKIVTSGTVCDDKSVRRSVSPKNCEYCHAEQAVQFSKGKHAIAWQVIENLKNVGKLAGSFDAERDCSGCHKIGREDGRCDSCHTRHRFAASEARKPEACRTCHMGPDHPQWETYSASKHGSIYSMEGHEWFWENNLADWYKGPLVESSVIPRGPVCATCHMADGDHEVSSTWGAWGMRLSEKDPDWKKNRDLFFKGLGFFDDNGLLAPELKAIVKGHEPQFSKSTWINKREKMVKVCSQCHTSSFSKDVLNKADNTVKACDELLVKAIGIIDDLYKDGIIEKSESFFLHADILRFDSFKNPIEERLYKMFVLHRMKTYYGAFHNNPSYQHGSGWTEMKRDLSEIETMADNLRKKRSE